MNREQIYNEIKTLGLKDEVKKRYGRNYTQCSNFILLNLIKEVTEGLNRKVTASNTTPAASPGGACNSLSKLVEILAKKKILLKSEVNAILNF